MAHDVTEPAGRSLPTSAGPGLSQCCLPLTLAVICLLFLTNSAKADDVNDGPARFHDVNGWRGTLVATARASPATMSMHDELLRKTGGMGAHSTFEFNTFVSIDFVLDEYESDPSVWTGKVTGSQYEAGYHYFAHVPERDANDPDWKGYVETEWDYTANGALDFSGDPRVELLFHRERGWSVRMASGRLPTEAQSLVFIHVPTKEEQNPERDLIIGPDTTLRENFKATALGMGSTDNHPYPKTVSVLLGSNDKKEGPFPLIHGSMGVAPDVLWDYTVYLEPTSMDELKLEIEVPVEYKTWRPETTPQCDAGKPLAVTAKVVRAKGGPPKSTVEKFVWELIDTSQEPGVAMNFPLEAKDQRFDLDLDAEGEFFLLENKNQRMTRAVRSGFSDTVKVVPYDWGGWATLQVTAHMSDGCQVRGKLKGRSELGLRVPKRDKDSHIADGWKAQNKSGADDLDDEKVEGQKDNGDGYALYEEYRGWVVDGKHLAGDPKKKDFFVLNLIGGEAEPGIDLFEQLSQLRVHSELVPGEMSETTRLMNGNHREGARRVDQHGVWVKVFNKAGLGDDGAATVLNEAGVAGRPGLVKGIGILAQDDSGSAFNKPFNLPAEDVFFAFDRAIAHELLHSVGAEHHGGKGDYDIGLRLISPLHPKNRLGRPYFEGLGGETVRVLDETEQDVAAKHYKDLAEVEQFLRMGLMESYLKDARKFFAGREGYPELKRWGTPEAKAEADLEDAVSLLSPLLGLVGIEQGPHSGDQDCVMRYYFARFYEAKGRQEKTLYLVTPGTEPIGLGICRSGKGTGINDPGHKPQSRYGDAAGDAGNCFEQICPNDAIPPRSVK